MWSKRKTEMGSGKVAVLTTSSLLGLAIFCANLTPTSFFAVFSLGISDGASSARGADQAADLFGSTGIFTTISNVMLFIVGAISVIMVIVGGLRYVISGGNTTNVGTAKNTILYAVVGLVISLLAYAIINFVLESFMPGAGSSGGTNT
jgi:hypothetical protein